MDPLTTLILTMAAQEQTYGKTHQIVRFKYVQFIVDQYLNEVFLE